MECGSVCLLLQTPRYEVIATSENYISPSPLSFTPPFLSPGIPDSMIPSKADENSEGTHRGIDEVENVTENVNTQD